jgi:cytidylate kinase
MPAVKTIAIDGPAASGKTTLGKRLADELGFLFFDTGVMYRALTFTALQKQLNLNDEVAISALAESIEIDIAAPSRGDGRNADVLVNGRDITWEIRRTEVDANVSQVSAYPGVRQAMTIQQRRIGRRGNVVMVGRDIGTIVMPDADLKIYLDATLEVRAWRRYAELLERGEPADLHAILKAMHKRDEIDSTRSTAPLRPADDAVILDSDQLDAEQVFLQALDLALGDQI